VVRPSEGLYEWGGAGEIVLVRDNDLWRCDCDPGRESAYDASPGMLGAYWIGLYKNAQKDAPQRQGWWAQAVTGPTAGVRAATAPKKKRTPSAVWY